MFKLNKNQRFQLKKAYKSGMYRVADLAKKYNISVPTLYKIVRGEMDVKKPVSKRRTAEDAYKNSYVRQVELLGALGLNYKQIADFFGIHVDTLLNWRNKHKSFGEALEKGRINVATKIVSRLIERAEGYTHPSEKIFYQNDKVVRVPFLKHYPPSEKAALAYLAAHMLETWGDKKRMIIQEGGPVQLQDDDIKSIKKIFDKLIAKDE